ncbi:unnamed protein product [Brachionus calyciflorus]|uniref:Integrase catalytic domain-containing protein n=1 Tax=Brachionus calyciflorus TaxID=104777 RepID=A0A814FK67_9BILA|nr:unnamed protein product [Brachionus calyciflorus]
MNQPLTWIMKKKNTHPRLEGWLLRLSVCSFEIVYKPGRENIIPDCFSRIPEDDGIESKSKDYLDNLVATIDKEKIHELKSESELDGENATEEHLNKVSKSLTDDQLEYEDIKWLINLKNSNNEKPKINIFENIIRKILYKEYDNLIVMDGTFYHDKKICIKLCDVCQKVKANKQEHKAELLYLSPCRPNQLITTDLAGPFKSTSRGNQYIQVVICHFTKSVEFYQLKIKSLLSDANKQFQSKLFEIVYDFLDIRRLKTTPYHPQCDEQSERTIQTLKTMIKSYIDVDKSKWDLNSNAFAFAYNSTIHMSTKQTPFEMMFGRKPIIPVDTIVPSLENFDRVPIVNEFKLVDQNNQEVTVLEDFNKEVELKLPIIASDYLAELKNKLTLSYSVSEKIRNIRMDKAKINHERLIKKHEYKIGDLVLCNHPKLKKVSGSKRALMFQVHKDRLKIYFHFGITLPSIKEEPEETEPSSESREQSEKESSESSSTEQSDGEISKNASQKRIKIYCETVSDSSEYHSVCSSLSHLNLFENPQKTRSELFNNNEVSDKDDSDSDSDSSIISVIEVQKPEPEPLEQILTYEDLIEELETEKSARIEIEKKLKLCLKQLRVKDDNISKLVTLIQLVKVENNKLKNELEIVMAEKLVAVENYDELDKKANRIKFLFEGREERKDSLEKLVDLKDLEIEQLQNKLNDLIEIQNCRDELDITKSQNVLNEKLNIGNSFIKKFVNSNSRLFKCYMEMLNES